MSKEQVASIVRSLNILECFADDQTEWTLKALVAQLGLPTTTVFRQVSTLVGMGYLTQDAVRKSYHVGPRLLLFASAVLGQSDLRSLAHPELEDLSSVVKETVNLCLLMELDIFYLDKVETFRSVACNTRIGTRVRAHTTAAGKMLLSAQPEELLDLYCQKVFPFTPKTPNTITGEDQLRAELAAVRQNGYAIDNEEIEQGLTCVSGPIYDMNEQMVAAVSVAGPTFRMSSDLDSMIHEVKLTASNISRLLGHRAGR